MPKNQVSDPITDQEIAFAHLVLSGTMTDRQAAEAAGLNPDTAAYTKARVRDYMLEHRAAVREHLVQQETDLSRPAVDLSRPAVDLSRPAVEGLHRQNIGREQVLTRLWEIANMSPEMTRNSVTGKVKALAMIVAIEGLIPDRRAGSSEKKSAQPPPRPNTYRASWLPERQGETTDPHPSPDLVPDEEPAPDPAAAADAPSDPGPTLSPAPTPTVDPSESIPVQPLSPSETTPSSPYARVPDSAPDLRAPFSIQNNRFGRRR
jgi:hypothetical protein